MARCGCGYNTMVYPVVKIGSCKKHKPKLRQKAKTKSKK